LPTIEEAEQTVHKLYDKELITEEQNNAFDIEDIVQFFHTEIGGQLIGAKWKDREVPFSLALPAKEIYPDAQEADEPL
ncbi:hypothetical protein MMK25_36705, partial [Bacillus cereus]|nr:hypothetical protein [Bacillus cereus]